MSRKTKLLGICADDIVRFLYRLEYKKADGKFVELLDLLPGVLDETGINIDDTLLAMQGAYENKDYVRFCDILLYELKPVLGLTYGLDAPEDGSDR